MSLADQADLIKYLNATRARQNSFSFGTVRAILNEKFGVPTAQGWDLLIQRYHAISPTHKDLQPALAGAKEAHKASILYGNRALTIFEVPHSVASVMLRTCQKLVNPQSVFAASFPFPVDRSTLERSSWNAEFVKFVRNTEDNSVRLIACSKRAYRERKTIDVGSLTAAASQALGSYDEVIGVTSGYVQAYDSVVIRPNGRIEIHIDMCCPMPLAESDIIQFMKYYIDVLNTAFPPPPNQQKHLYRPLNLFGLVQAFYDDNDGKVRNLGHATGTNSVKQERMRSRKDDLRVEPFHRKGLAAIDSTDLYSIEKTWSGELSSVFPSVTLPGKFSMAGDIDARIDYAIVGNCSGKIDFDQTVARLRET